MDAQERQSAGGRNLWRSLGWLVPLGVVVVWQLLLGGQPGRGRLAPTPLGVVRSFGELALSGDLVHALGVSLSRIAVGFGVAACVGILLGLAMGHWRAVEEVIDPLVETFRPIAPIAWIPLAILWLGSGSASAAFIVGYAAFFPIVVNTVAAVKEVDPKLIRAAKVYGANPAMLFRDVIWPGALPTILVGARLGMGAAWSSIVAAEMTVGAKAGVGATGGIGQMMFVFFNYSTDLSPIVVGMLTIGAVALLIDTAFLLLAKVLLPWHRA